MNVDRSPLICGTSDKALHAERPNQAPTPKQSSLAMQPHGVTDRLRQFSKKYKSLQEMSLASAQQPMSLQETLPNDRPSFERFLEAMEAQMLAAASFLVMDGAVRAQYQRLIHDMSRELMAKVARRVKPRSWCLGRHRRQAVCARPQSRHGWALAVVRALQHIPHRGSTHPQGLVQRCLGSSALRAAKAGQRTVAMQ
jgi:hypothetical protein